MVKGGVLLCGTSFLTVATLSHIIRLRIRKRREEDEEDECDIIGVLSGHWSFSHWLACRDCPSLLRLLLKQGTSWWLSPNAMSKKGRWTPLHIAATNGCADAAFALIESGACLDTMDMNGHTALAIAIARGHKCIATQLLARGATTDSMDTKMVTPLHLAALRGDAELCALLLEHGSKLDTQDSGGWTSLLVACKQESRWFAAKCLLENGANAGASIYVKNLTAPMLVAEWPKLGSEAMCLLLDCNADAAAVDNFGQTALHLACRHGSANIVKVLCDKGAPVSAQDNDGLYPMQLLLDCCARAPNDSKLVDLALSAILRADSEAVKHLDFSDSSAVHTLLCLAGVHKTAPLLALNALLDAKADATVEDDSGFTVVHYASALQAPDRDAVMNLLCESPQVPQGFWTVVNLQKKRDMSNRKYLMRRGGHHRIPLETRVAVLGGDVSLAGIAQRIIEGRARNIVVLVGAGASTAAGVPDFRSASGLWSHEATRELFSYEGFHAKPEDFWHKASELFMDRRPTKFHFFLGLLASKGLLRRVYTQNIDGLEVVAGVPEQSIIECHGSALRTVCSANRSHVTQTTTKPEASQAWRAPRCSTCGALLRPDIIFFGEPLPRDFSLHSGEDLNLCDLLIVVGTALNVYPVAGIVNQVSSLTPRLLINRDSVGVWRGSEMNPENYRDVMWRGECDDGAEELTRLLGW